MFVRALRPEHPLHSSQKPALVRVMSYPVLLSRRHSASLSRRLSSELDASHQSLQPTCCHEHPLEHAIPKLWAFALPTAAGFPASRTEWELGFPHGSTCCDARKPLLVCLALGSQAVGAASASCYRITTPHGMNGVPSKRPCERYQPTTTCVTRIADAPCRIPPPCSASRAYQRVPESASPRSTKSAFPQIRGAFRHQVPPSLSDSRRPPTAWAATGTLGSSPRAQLPTCVHAPTRETLDPTAYRLFTGAEGPHAACQLLQRSVPRARHRTARTPVKTWQATFSPNGNVPFEPSPTELPQVRGHLACLTASTPTTSDRSPQWIYPNLIGSGTPCHEIVPNGAWKKLSSAVLRCWTSCERSRPEHLTFARCSS